MEGRVGTPHFVSYSEITVSCIPARLLSQPHPGRTFLFSVDRRGGISKQTFFLLY